MNHYVDNWQGERREKPYRTQQCVLQPYLGETVQRHGRVASPYMHNVVVSARRELSVVRGPLDPAHLAAVSHQRRCGRVRGADVPEPN